MNNIKFQLHEINLFFFLHEVKLQAFIPVTFNALVLIFFLWPLIIMTKKNRKHCRGSSGFVMVLMFIMEIILIIMESVKVLGDSAGN